MRHFIVLALLATGLAGCQTAQQSLASAEYVCQGQGLRPGTRSYTNCVNANYRENRRESQATANAVAAGAAAGIVGGAVIAASTPVYDPYYGPYYGRGYYGGPRYYRRGWCDAYGCY